MFFGRSCKDANGGGGGGVNDVRCGLLTKVIMSCYDDKQCAGSLDDKQFSVAIECWQRLVAAVPTGFSLRQQAIRLKTLGKMPKQQKEKAMNSLASLTDP